MSFIWMIIVGLVAGLLARASSQVATRWAG